MSVRLAERAIDVLTARLQAQLGAELALIDTDRADGVTMAVPAAATYYKRQKAEIAGATCHVEVYELAFEFSDSYVDADAQRAVYDLTLFVRVTYYNRTQDTAETMMKRMRRYGCGVFNVVNKDYRLGGSDPAIKAAKVRSITPHLESEGTNEDIYTKARVTVAVDVKCEETQA